ncbi:hypothetical protein [Thiobacillus sp.]|uniref:hypothetical protein n=1 Tax=Thiobacillus sp. TaxID=924 RepID=UPI0025E90A9E|nr:hypothetical protein [Thiobacillus sp.]MBT9538923.1 hypothetical protein [Thiobacillus sp.]
MTAMLIPDDEEKKGRKDESLRHSSPPYHGWRAAANAGLIVKADQAWLPATWVRPKPVARKVVSDQT